VRQVLISDHNNCTPREVEHFRLVIAHEAECLPLMKYFLFS